MCAYRLTNCDLRTWEQGGAGGSPLARDQPRLHKPMTSLFNQVLAPAIVSFGIYLQTLFTGINAKNVSQLPLVAGWDFCLSFTEVETEAQ